MALVIADRVRETSTTTGTGTLTLDGAVSGYRTFSSAIGNSNTCYYTITLGSDWEVGIGTVGAGTLARTTVLKSSNSNSAVNFGLGTKDVFVTYPADRSVATDNSQTFTAAQTFRASNAIRSEAASTQDAIVIAGRAGGTSSYAATVTPTTLTGNRTVTLPDANIDFTSGLGVAQGGTGQITYTNGQLLIGNSTGNTLTKATLTAGSGITITNGTGSITIASSGGTSAGLVRAIAINCILP